MFRQAQSRSLYGNPNNPKLTRKLKKNGNWKEIPLLDYIYEKASLIKIYYKPLLIRQMEQNKVQNLI